MTKKYTLDHVINLYYNQFSVVMHVTSLFIEVYAITTCLLAYCSHCSSAQREDHQRPIINKDVRSMIFRRQIIYFIVLIALELPYTGYVLAIGMIAPRIHEPAYL